MLLVPLFGALFRDTSKMKEMGGELVLDGQNLMETHNNQPAIKNLGGRVLERWRAGGGAHGGMLSHHLEDN
jgi:hypothetical protein